MIRKMSKYTFLFVKIAFILVILFIVDSSSTIRQNKVENENFNRNVDLTTMALKVNEMAENDLFTAIDTYTGQLTGYAHDCPLCGGKLACASNYDITDRRDYYPDKEYGNVKIVASSKNLSCGTIIRFNKPSLSPEPIIAIVLDRGVPGNNLDLLTPTEDYAVKYIGRSTVTYDVLRTGW